MKFDRIPAVFMRGGTSKGVIFRRSDLPADRSSWDPLFLSLMGSPDPYGRQLDGMGGGVSSLSKVCVVAPPSHPDADVDYTFAQVMVGEARVDYSGNCGNMSSAIGPYAVAEKIVEAADGEAVVRIFNTNTRKLIHATFEVRDGQPVRNGTLRIPGVSGTGAPVRLDFLEPGGATTGRLLPTGNAVDVLDVPGFGSIQASMVDAANACVFVEAASLGLSGIEMPSRIAEQRQLCQLLEEIRASASVAMGITPNREAAHARRLVPFVGFVAGPMSSATLSGEQIGPDDVDLTVRMISNGQPHLALPLTASLCTAVAARIPGTLVNRLTRPVPGQGALRIGMPSGVLTVDAEAGRDRTGAPVAIRGSFFRTARRLFDGHVYP
ncbi:MAG: PrpF family protein [Burkholderiaceae bacterium]|nr:PrpF family protein [Burkholderiaceae bacterium]